MRRRQWAGVSQAFVRKVGDHWEPKAERAGGIDVDGKSKGALIAEARRRGANVTTHMTKAEVAEELKRSNDRAMRHAGNH